MGIGHKIWRVKGNYKMARRTHGMGSLIKLKNSPYWHARFYHNGRKISMSTGTDVKKEAEAFLRDQMDKVQNKGLVPLVDMRKLTYRDLRAGLLANYVEKGNKSLRPRKDGEETIVGLPQLDSFFQYDDQHPGPKVVDIGTDTGRAFVAQRQAEGAGNAVINRSLACLRRMLKIAHEEGKISAVPVIRLLKEPPARKGFVELEQFENLLRHLPTHLKPYVLFLYHCGGRSGEAALIEWHQVDLQRRCIWLEAEQTKGDEARVVPLPSELVVILERQQPKTGRVFDTTNLRKEWCKACAAAGLGRIIKVEGKPYDPRYEGLTVHDLRRSAVRNLVTIAGVPERIAMKITGHKTRAVFDRYHIVNPDDVVGAMRAWEVAAAKNLSPQGNGYSLGKPAAHA